MTQSNDGISPALVGHAGEIELAGISKRYGQVTALDRIDLHIPAGSLTVIVGPSGCGKSTLLRLLSGLEAPSGGTLRMDGLDVTGQGAGERDIAMVFQDYALYPHMTVAANVSFGLRLQSRHDRRNGPTKADIGERVAQVAALLGLEPLLGRKPAQLSGGQRQRVALARAIIRRPQVLLLDEPLSALDAQLRASARAELLRLHREIGATLVLVTHDQHEALSMATHLVVMDRGRVAQSGTAEELFRHPATEFVAAFVGSPTMNLQADGRSGRGGGRLGWRATDARILSAGETADGLVIAGTVDVCEFTGAGQEVLFRNGDGAFVALQHDGETWLRPGDGIRVVVPEARLHCFDEHGLRIDG
jgi:multiple sugar transport system ATP-binding protein